MWIGEEAYDGVGESGAVQGDVREDVEEGGCEDESEREMNGCGMNRMAIPSNFSQPNIDDGWHFEFLVV